MHTTHIVIIIEQTIEDNNYIFSNLCVHYKTDNDRFGLILIGYDFKAKKIEGKKSWLYLKWGKNSQTLTILAFTLSDINQGVSKSGQAHFKND